MFWLSENLSATEGWNRCVLIPCRPSRKNTNPRQSNEKHDLMHCNQGSLTKEHKRQNLINIDRQKIALYGVREVANWKFQRQEGVTTSQAVLSTRTKFDILHFVIPRAHRIFDLQRRMHLIRVLEISTCTHQSITYFRHSISSTIRTCTSPQLRMILVNCNYLVDSIFRRKRCKAWLVGLIHGEQCICTKSRRQNIFWIYQSKYIQFRYLFK